MFYAMLDRKRIKMRILNGCLRFELPSGGLSAPRYFFSVTQSVLDQSPFSEGTIYVLPKAGFVVQPPYKLGDWTVHDPHWACLSEVKPLAKLAIQPNDFPFLARVRGHHDETVMTRAKANPQGFPWL